MFFYSPISNYTISEVVISLKLFIPPDEPMVFALKHPIIFACKLTKIIIVIEF